MLHSSLRTHTPPSASKSANRFAPGSIVHATVRRWSLCSLNPASLDNPAVYLRQRCLDVVEERNESFYMVHNSRLHLSGSGLSHNVQVLKKNHFSEVMRRVKKRSKFLSFWTGIERIRTLFCERIPSAQSSHEEDPRWDPLQLVHEQDPSFS